MGDVFPGIASRTPSEAFLPKQVLHRARKHAFSTLSGLLPALRTRRITQKAHPCDIVFILSIGAFKQAVSGLIGEIVSLFTILAIQASWPRASHTLCSTGYTKKVDSILVEIFRRTDTDVSGVISTIAVDTGIDAHGSPDKQEWLVPAIRVANRADEERGAL